MKLQSTPSPIPARPGGSPAEWAPRDLVRAQFTYNDKFEHDHRYRASWTSTGNVNSFIPLKAATLADAIDATALISSNGISWGNKEAHGALAVLQSGAGRYYATGLLAQGVNGSDNLKFEDDPARGLIDYHLIERLHPDVKAIVSRTDQIVFDPADES